MAGRGVLAALTGRLRQTLRRKNLLPREKKVLVALSGGQDSLALTEALLNLHKAAPWTAFSVAHCDHRWPHDAGNADLVLNYARSRRLRLHLIDAAHHHAPIPLSENAAREWRYAELDSLAARHGYTDVVTAHTQTDLAETVLFTLSHGSGPDGLSALTWTRPLSPGIALVRPFLNVSREETATFCRQASLTVWHDRYNDDTRYARNRIRADVMPILKQHINPRVEEALARTAHLLRDDTAHLDKEAELVFGRTVVVRRLGHARKLARLDRYAIPFAKEGAGESHEAIVVLLDRPALLQETVAVQRRVVKLALCRYVGLTHRAAIFAQVEDVCALLTASVGTSSASLAGHASASVVDEGTVAIELPLACGATKPQSIGMRNLVQHLT